MDRGLRAVLLDAVGTLIELREPVGETYARLAREHGVELPAERVGQVFGRVFRQAGPMFPPHAPVGQTPDLERVWWRRVVRDTFRSADRTARFADFDACFEQLWHHFAGAGAWRRRAGSREILEALRASGLATAVVSNFDRRLPPLLQALGLGEHLDAVVLPADAGAAKPDPRIFAVALERLGLPAAAALYVGDDRERDVEGARGAGLRAVDVASLANLGELTHLLDAATREPAP